MLKKINLSIYIAILLSLLLVGCAKRNDTKDETIVSEIPQTKMETQEETTSNSTIESIDLEKAFKNINGCAVIYSPKNNHYSFYNEDMCKQQVSPYSTFKIISVLSGLENGVLSDETSKMSYNGTIYANADWNADLSLKDAFQKSCIWYFKQVIDTVGKDKIKEELTSLKYGNCDISEWDGSNINPSADLNGFWLESSLAISPSEQVKVLETIFEGKSGYSTTNIQILKDLMLIEENELKKIYGKTGSGNGKAWFVGFSETMDDRDYFAIYLQDDTKQDSISGKKAMEIALTIINN